MSLFALIDQFVDFFGGPKLVSGDQLGKLATLVCAARDGYVAHAGGGQAGATPLLPNLATVATVANANDSVTLPLAIPGAQITVINASANAMQVFGVAANPSNGGVGDTITPQASTAASPSATGISQASGVACTYFCTSLGKWKQGSIS